ncbi:MAG: LTA synthase family protein [Candidatus Pseudobacter hemicellulosilyticus]|uniref:LTA synthase family protein n=1 Tax=Candidatus Pseudobacter hemicellulosilyticus TaxID=3121375 RepID=A0AAJ5WZE1_9BACT|nr:MAG: LTA synthase family protein [Pseudobacter sp.]
MKDLFRNRYSLVWVLAIFFLAISFITRVVLLLSTHDNGIGVWQGAGAFLIGILYDLIVATFIIVPFVLHIWWQNDHIYNKKIIPVVCVLFTAAVLLLLLTNIVPRDFSPELHTALVSYIIIRFAIYLSLCYLPYSFRLKWRQGVLKFSFFLVAFLLLFNAVSEWFFWQEFSTRYNFIAVDYLVYTTEVLGNISESYPMTTIISAVVITTLTVAWSGRKAVYATVNTPMPFLKRTLVAIGLLLLPVMAWYGVNERWHHFSRNEYANSLAGNGLYEFTVAFGQNELDYFRFYRTIDDAASFSIVRQQLQGPHTHFIGQDPYSIERQISYDGPDRKWNVVLISVESLSADFMEAFGNKEHITPYLDSLASHSLFFTKLYASGTRTVRGLEALSLSIPPTPGQSIVKRPDNGHLFSLGSVFRSKGYITQYLYGGYSYFDNMKTFFGSNGYQVIDRSAIPPERVHYQNIWGVADEDLFTLALNILDSNHSSGKPFFSHIMTVSNHRPYTYPDGRIDIPPSRQVRQGAVKYTDFAINKFLREASTRKWFDSTVFVIVADHCAGSAGSVELPVNGYHIPLLIYAPKLVVPGQVNSLMAQIDVAPTLLGLLQFNYRSKFFGQDVLNAGPDKSRAFISTYQGLGYLRNDRLVIQSPVRNVHSYITDLSSGRSIPIKTADSLVTEAIAWYQSTSWLLKRKKQSE